MKWASDGGYLCSDAIFTILCAKGIDHDFGIEKCSKEL